MNSEINCTFKGNCRGLPAGTPLTLSDDLWEWSFRLATFSLGSWFLVSTVDFWLHSEFTTSVTASLAILLTTSHCCVGIEANAVSIVVFWQWGAPMVWEWYFLFIEKETHMSWKCNQGWLVYNAYVWMFLVTFWAYYLWYFLVTTASYEPHTVMLV